MSQTEVNPRAVTKAHVAFGKRLRAARLAADLSQNELGNELGVSFQQIQKYEKGTNRMDITRITTAAKVLCVSTRDLLGINKDDEAVRPSVIEDMMATREGVQIVRAMADLNMPQRQLLVDIARRLSKVCDD